MKKKECAKNLTFDTPSLLLSICKICGEKTAACVALSILIIVISISLTTTPEITDQVSCFNGLFEISAKLLFLYLPNSTIFGAFTL